MKYLAVRGEKSFTVDVEEQEGHMRVEIDGAVMRIDAVPVDGDATFSLLVDGRSHTATLLDFSETCSVMIDGTAYEFEVEEEAMARLRREVKRKHHAGGEQIKAPMPGRIIAIEVAAGDVLEAGQGAVIIEAMKMENELRTHLGGRVKEVRAKVGDAVNKGDVLVVLEERQGDE